MPQLAGDHNRARGRSEPSLLRDVLVAAALPARDRAVAPFDRGSHHAAALSWADGDAAWANADGGVIALWNLRGMEPLCSRPPSSSPLRAGLFFGTRRPRWSPSTSR